MSERVIAARPLTREAFAEFGAVIDRNGRVPRPMNGDRALRYHALATAQALGEGAEVVLSLVDSKPAPAPFRLAFVERHPLGSQAFIPLSDAPFLVTVCPDQDGHPGEPLAFVSAPGQGVNYRVGTWHGVLAPIGGAQSFLVVDREGVGLNLEEFVFDAPWRIDLKSLGV